MSKSKTISVRGEVYEHLQTVAERTGNSVAWLVEQACKNLPPPGSDQGLLLAERVWQSMPQGSRTMRGG